VDSSIKGYIISGDEFIGCENISRKEETNSVDNNTFLLLYYFFSDDFNDAKHIEKYFLR
jgi:hypothetical protein